MGILKRVLAVTLAAITLALGIHFVGGELYGGLMPEPHLVWDYLNWLTALGILVTLVFHFQRKREFDRRQQDDNVSFAYLSKNFLLFAAMFLTIWFFANWFEELYGSPDTPGAVVGFVWIGFNASFAVLGGITAWQLWNSEDEQWGRSPASGSPAPAVQGTATRPDDGQPGPGTPREMAFSPSTEGESPVPGGGREVSA
ncbi:MAG: hypothetical protein OXI91_14820 [Chloroflexota bacterium]|nr:hypothetical protein [Chloroflexota bacterium]